jgi:hypothetical protein
LSLARKRFFQAMGYGAIFPALIGTVFWHKQLGPLPDAVPFALAVWLVGIAVAGLRYMASRPVGAAASHSSGEVGRTPWPTRACTVASR